MKDNNLPSRTKRSKKDRPFALQACLSSQQEAQAFPVKVLAHHNLCLKCNATSKKLAK
jgi:hypothetical protein